ncbi:MAG: tetratricopeptide repeat protein [Thermoleophilia bacterium]|nr:tetratricopeptide repeat protein [Thermoleophilia bacterium]
MGFEEAGERVSSRFKVHAVATGALLLALALIAGVCLAAGGCKDAMAEARALESEGDLDGAVALYKDLLKKEPDNGEALSAAAVDLLLLGRFDEALPLQERVVSLDPDDVQTRIELGFNYLNHQGRPTDAVRVLTEAVLLEPGAKNKTFLAQALLAAGDATAGEQRLREAIEMDAGYGHSYSVLVGLLEAQGRAEEAASIIEQASVHGVTVRDSR